MSTNETAIAYIGLGSNLDEPLVQLAKALQAIAAFPSTELLKISPYYQNPPLGPQDQPDFFNAVAQIKTGLTAHGLLNQLQAVEKNQNRQRLVQWGPRTLDLDLLLFADLVLSTPKLTLPHPGLQTRNFVVYPLYAIAPDLILPCGKSLESLIQDGSLTPLVAYAKPLSY